MDNEDVAKEWFNIAEADCLRQSFREIHCQYTVSNMLYVLT